MGCVHGRGRAVYGRIHGQCIQRLHGPYVYTARTRPCTRPCNGSTYGKYNYSHYDSQWPFVQLTTPAPSSGRQQQHVLFLRSWATCLFSTHYAGQPSDRGRLRNRTEEFGFFPPQLYQHLHPHSTYHLGSRTYPLTPDLQWHQCL